MFNATPPFPPPHTHTHPIHTETHENIKRLMLQIVRSVLAASDYRQAESAEEADVVLINTCSIRLGCLLNSNLSYFYTRAHLCCTKVKRGYNLAERSEQGPKGAVLKPPCKKIKLFS